MPIKSIYGDVEIIEKPFHDVMRNVISKNAVKYPGRPALIDGQSGKRFSFEDVNNLSRTVENYLHRKGLRKNDRVLICLPNCIEFPAIILGISAAGGIFSGINSSCTKDEILHQMVDCECKYIFTTDAFLVKVLAAVQKLPIGQIKEIIAFRTNKSKMLPDNVTDFAQVMQSQIDYNLPKIYFDPKNDTLMLPYSSGTTGVAKGVMLTHYNISAMISVRQRAHEMNTKTFTGSTCTIQFLPFYHLFGYCMLMHYLNMGITQVVVGKFDLEKYLQLIEKYKPLYLHMVPPVFVLLAKHPLVDKYDISSVKSFLVGGAPLGKELCDDFKTRHSNDIEVVQGYGMTETAAICHLPWAEKMSPGSVGFVTSNMECMIVHAGSGRELGPMEEGEILLRGPTVMKGYWKRPKATSESLDQNGWLHTGDIGYCDKNDCLFIVDRIKELIKVKGYQVAPAELEDLLHSHPDIQDCAVVGVPDLLSGELPKAYIVLKHGKRANIDDIQNFVKDKLIYYKHLKGGIEFVNEIPKSPSGKILRRLLRDREKKIHSKL